LPRSCRRSRPDGEPHTLLDFLFDAFRRRCDKLGVALVEEQHGGRIGAQELTNSSQELVEEAFDRQVRKRGIGDGLNAPQVLRGQRGTGVGDSHSRKDHAERQSVSNDPALAWPEKR